MEFVYIGFYFFFVCLTSNTRTPARWKSVECRTIRCHHHHHHPHHHNNKWIITVWCLPRLKHAEIQTGVSAKQKSSSYRCILCLWPSGGDMLREERQYRRQFFSFSFLEILTYLVDRLKKKEKEISLHLGFWLRSVWYTTFKQHILQGFFSLSSDPLRPIFLKYTQLLCNRECWIFMRKT